MSQDRYPKQDSHVGWPWEFLKWILLLNNKVAKFESGRLQQVTPQIFKACALSCKIREIYFSNKFFMTAKMWNNMKREGWRAFRAISRQGLPGPERLPPGTHCLRPCFRERRGSGLYSGNTMFVTIQSGYGCNRGTEQTRKSFSFFVQSPKKFLFFWTFFPKCCYTFESFRFAPWFQYGVAVFFLYLLLMWDGWYRWTFFESRSRIHRRY